MDAWVHTDNLCACIHLYTGILKLLMTFFSYRSSWDWDFFSNVFLSLTNANAIAAQIVTTWASIFIVSIFISRQFETTVKFTSLKTKKKFAFHLIWKLLLDFMIVIYVNVFQHLLIVYIWHKQLTATMLHYRRGSVVLLFREPFTYGRILHTHTPAQTCVCCRFVYTSN